MLLFRNYQISLATNTFRVRFDIRIISRNFMNNSAIGSIKVNSIIFASFSYAANPAFRFFGNSVGALAFIIRNIDIYAY